MARHGPGSRAPPAPWAFSGHRLANATDVWPARPPLPDMRVPQFAPEGQHPTEIAPDREKRAVAPQRLTRRIDTLLMPDVHIGVPK